MTVKFRLSGEPDEVAAVLAALARVAEVATDGRQYGNRGAFGVRVYGEVRALETVTARAERADRSTTPARVLGRGGLAR